MANARPASANTGGSQSKENTSCSIKPERSVGHNRSKDEIPKSTLQLQGTICRLYETCGFIKPQQKLQEKYNQDVFFHIDKLPTVLRKHVKVNDQLGFTLNVYKPDKPRAHNVQVIKWSKRSTEEVEKFLEETVLFLVGKCSRDKSAHGDSLQSSVIGLMRCTEIWNCIGSADHITDGAVERIMSIMLILEKHKTNLKQNFENILHVLFRTPFLNVRNGRLLTYIHTIVKNRNSQKTIKDFLLLLIHHLPMKSKAVLHLVRPIVDSDQCDAKYVFSLLKESVNGGFTAVKDMEWDELPIVPDINEYLGNDDHGYLQPVKPKGPYESPHEYMDTYFRLLRADCFSDLCKGIKCFLKETLDHRNINVYHSMSLVGVKANPSDSSVLICAMKVIPFMKVLDWKTSSNFLFGNLLAMSPSGTFRDVIWATVVNRDADMLKNKQVIMVEVCSEANSISDVEAILMLQRCSGRILMVESPTYYKAFQPVLKALQKMEVDRLAFKDHLVHAKKPAKPDFISENTTVDGSVVYSDSPSNIPISSVSEDCESFNTNLDDSQMEAIKKAIMQNIAIIQGPPGTGKTFIGLKIIRLLLSMSTKPKSPILVLTYKNHALDEFLKGLIEWFPDDIVRVGGRSSEDKLVGCNLNELKRNQVPPKDISTDISTMKDEEKVLQKKVTELLSNLKAITYFTDKCFLENATVSQMKNLFLQVDWDKSKATMKVSSEDGKSENDVKVTKDLATNIVNKEFFSSNQGVLREMLNYWLPDKKVIDTVESALNLMHSSKFPLEKPFESSLNERKHDIDDARDIEELLRERFVEDSREKKYTLDDFVTFESIETYYHIRLFPSAKELLKDNTKELERVDELCRLRAGERVTLLQLWLLKQVNGAKQALTEALREYERVCESRTELENQHLANVMADKWIIGMTITGASIQQKLLAKVRPAIVIVEEAAEVLEPQLVAVLGDWVQQLILIGDHKQLRPMVESYRLKKDFYFDVSMMERLINNDFPYSTLKKQNRMRPEFAELLLDIYPELKSNMDRVKDNEHPKCLKKSMFFWSHTDIETGDRSYTNVGEAKRIVQLTLFFLIHQYKPNQITILSAYKSQMSLLRDMLHNSKMKYPELFQISQETKDKDDGKRSSPIQVQTIDNYQGDENDVVLVSLVKSNEEKKTGFVKSQNRRCVAQSRARCCMVFVGNKETLGTVPVWNTLLSKMEGQGCVGNSIELCCPRHNNVSFFQAREGKDVKLDDFCSLPCNAKMPCGRHICDKPCQPNHTHMVCKEIVEFNHAKCNHPGKRYCYQKESDVQCETEVVLAHRDCGHIRRRFCYQNEDLPCLEKCGQKKPCGHNCQETCQSQHNHDVCEELVQYIHPKCKHTGQKKCTENLNSILCTKEVNFQFPLCKHSGKKMCYESIESKICKEKCTRKLPNCNHPCSLTCGELCDPGKCVDCKEIEKVKEEQRQEVEAMLIKTTRQQIKKDLDDLRKRPITNECFRKELKDQEETAAEYFDVANKVRKYIQPDRQWYPIVRKIEEVQNFNLLEKYLEAKSEMFNPSRSELKFYGTSEENVEKIIKDGFHLPTKGGRFGNGIYFATDVPMSDQGKFLLCEVLLGRTKTVNRHYPAMNKKTLQKDKCDSLFAKRGTKETKGLEFDEFVIYNPDQILPKYIIHYERASFQDPVRFNSLENEILRSGHKTVKKYIIKSKREMSFDDPFEMHYRFVESQYLRLKKKLPDIDYIEYYINPGLLEKFNKKKSEMEEKYGQSVESKFILAFHGTNETNIPSIVENNLSLSHLGKSTGDLGWYGAGIYFSEFPDITSQYGKSLLLCRILPGKSYDCLSRMDGQPCMAGYDSHRFRKDREGRGRELVIFDEAQILPSYVIYLK